MGICYKCKKESDELKKCELIDIQGIRVIDYFCPDCVSELKENNFVTITDLNGVVALFMEFVAGLMILAPSCWSLYYANKLGKRRPRTGKCPYCNVQLIVYPSQFTCSCPSCGNIMRQTLYALETVPDTNEYKNRNNNVTGESAQQEAIRQQLLELDNRFITLMTADFEELGWTEWDESIHKADGQLDRIKRAADPNSHIALTRYDPSMGIAKMRGSGFNYYLVSGHRCSCPDFRKRQLPCKHMYYLAMVLPDYKEYIQSEDDDLKNILLDDQCDDTFYGLNFSIIGRSQKAAKMIISQRGGTFRNDSWKDTSAVVLASDEKTQRYFEACERNIEMLSFDELKTLFANTTDHDSMVLENDKQVDVKV